MSNELTTSYRKERIERLLEELRYEVTRGMMEGEVDETLTFNFIIPVSKQIPNGVVRCSFMTRPSIDIYATADDLSPRLRVVKP